MGQAPRRRGLHPLGPGKIPLPGLRSFRRGSSGAWDRGGYALSLRPCCPQALLSSVGVGTGYALPPPPRLGPAGPQIQNTQPLPHAPRKKARSLSPARLALRGRRDSRNSGCWRPTAVARGGRGLLSPWGSCFATARGRYHLFPGGGRGVARLDERPGFGIAFLALAENPAEGGRRRLAARGGPQGCPRPAKQKSAPGALGPGYALSGRFAPSRRPPRALGFCTAAPAGKAGREARAFRRPWNGGGRARA